MDGNQLVGRILAGRYKLVKLIGQGGMGSVYSGNDQQMSNRVIAVKILASHLVADEKQVARFEQEARAANQLRHPNTISVIDFGQSDGHIFMVLEYLTGETLTQVLRKGRLETTRSLYMIRQILKSLAEAHSKGIIHRDLKPDNIFVCEIYGEKDFIKVIDFGIAKFLEAGGQELTQAGKMFGTPRYLSPEQAQGLPLSAASDLYSLGVILFEMLSGRPPFLAEDPIAVAIKHVQEPPPKFVDVAPDLYLPEELDHMVFKLLAKKALQRFQSAEEVLEAIDRVMADLVGPRHPSGQFPVPANRTPGRPITMPPPSRRSQPPPSRNSQPVQENAEEDATRALDTLSASPGHEPAATMAMDVASAPRPEAATMALDTFDAQAHLDRAASQATAKARGPAHQGTSKTAQQAPAQESSATSRLLLLLVIAIVLIGGAVAAVLLTRGEAKPATAAAAGSETADKSEKAGTASGGTEGPDQAAKDKAAQAAQAAQATQAAQAKADQAAKDKADQLAAAKAAAPEPAGAADAGSATPDVAVGAAAADVLAAPAAVAMLKMEITSKPGGATVALDGNNVGKTPFTVELKPGAFQKLTLKKDGFDPFDVDFATLSVLAPTKPQFDATLTASKSVIKKVFKQKPKWDM